MDYVVGSVAALISGNVTPNRSRIVKRALTPTKHQPSPNVTPKSQIVEDRSIFLSPTLQKKKAIVKKSPKRIFQNPDHEETLDGQNTMCSPKADSVKKHLEDDLDATENKKVKKSKGKHNISVESKSPKKNKESLLSDNQDINETAPKKKKKKNSDSGTLENVRCDDKENLDADMNNAEIISKKMNSKAVKVKNTEMNLGDNQGQERINVNDNQNYKKRKHAKTHTEIEPASIDADDNTKNNSAKKAAKSKKNKNKKKANKLSNDEPAKTTDESLHNQLTEYFTAEKRKKHKVKTVVNPNAITNKDTDSEHESDNEIESETENTNKILDEGPVDESSDEDQKKLSNGEEKRRDFDDDDIERTIFVGNVPYSKKCKKEMKRIFIKYGNIQTVRIRAVPVKDARVTPKLAIIKNELHPSRTTVNVYVKFIDAASVQKALVENNTVYNEHHLRVSRSNTTGAEADPRLAIFVGNLPFSAEDDALRDKFTSCGEISSVRIIRDQKTNAGKGFGYVNFTSKDAVELALGLSEEDLTMRNRILRVKRCTQMTENQKRRQNTIKDRSSRPGGWVRNRPASDGRNRPAPDGRNRPASVGRNRPGPDGRQGKPFGQGRPDKGDGAYRRIMKKRDHQDTSEGPPNKRARYINQPTEKKPRKEFVGMTAEKKKKRKFDKGQKKKKALSEILTK